MLKSRGFGIYLGTLMVFKNIILSRSTVLQSLEISIMKIRD